MTHFGSFSEPNLGSYRSLKGRWSDLLGKARKRGGKARHPGLHQDNVPVLVARDRRGATFDAVLPQVDSASIAAALAGLVRPDNHLIGAGGRAIAAFARRAKIPFHAVPAPGKPAPEAPHLHINTSMPIAAVSSNGSPASTASPPRTCKTLSAGAARLKPGAINLLRKPGSRALSETAHTNS